MQLEPKPYLFQVESTGVHIPHSSLAGGTPEVRFHRAPYRSKWRIPMNRKRQSIGVQEHPASRPCSLETCGSHPRTPLTRVVLEPVVPVPSRCSHGLVANSPMMASLLDLARRVAGVDATILITGETGSGKEMLARFIHEHSGRAAGPFVAVNCAAISESLFESELFGHAKGAFSDAIQERQGLFEAANGGTLLLDEIGEISLAMQVKLLRAIQEREVRRVGENRTRPVDVRILAATNCNLAQEVERGRFRLDLLYRLKVVELPVPALRERRADILPLAHIHLAHIALRMNRDIRDIAPMAATRLVDYAWPGNVRELVNAMERAVAIAANTRVECEDLPEEVILASGRTLARENPAQPKVESVRPISEVMKEYILATLASNEGNQRSTAEQLRIGSATLYRKLKSYGLIGHPQMPRNAPILAPDLPSAS